MAKSALARAREALEKGDEEAALEALLVAWRASRSNRIADLIDRVSEPLVAKDGPVKGKTVKLRTEAWFALAKEPSPRQVGRLVATPWPGKWADAIPIATALAALPHDPRITMMFAKTIEATPWDTYTSNRFYWPVLHHLATTGDLRTLPILEADLQRQKSHYWNRSTRPDVVSTVKKLSEASAGEEDEEELAALEARFAGEVSTSIASAKSEDELLAAIYAAPNDDVPRVVYADFLLEKGDPRGELITLQLASGGTPAEQEKRRKRIKTLLNKHGTEWAEPLDRFLNKKTRAFERGFLARASLEAEGDKLAVGIDNPAWATLHTLGIDWSSQYRGHLGAIMALPSLQHVRRIMGLSLTEEVVALPARPAVEELDVQINHSGDVEEAFAKSRSFPNLRRLGIEGDLGRAALILAGPIGKALEMVTHYGYEHPIGPLVRLVEKLKLTKVKEIRSVHYLSSEGDSWRFAMTPDASGAFTVFYGVQHWSGRGSWAARYLVNALATLEPHELTSLTIDGTEPCDYDAGEIRDLEAALTRFPNLAHLDVPWERLAAKKPIDRDKQCPVFTSLWRAEKYDAETYRTIFEAVTASPLALSFDAYEVNNGAHQSLDDGLATLEKARAKKRTWGLVAYRKDAPDRLGFSYSSLDLQALIGRDVASVDAFLAWFAPFTATIGLRGRVSFVEVKTEADGSAAWKRSDLSRLQAFDASPDWIWVLDPEVDERLPFDELEKLPAKLDWLRAIRTERTLILVLGATPADPPSREELVRFDVAARGIFWAVYARKHGFLPHEVIAKFFTPMLKQRGFVRHELAPEDTASGKLVFAASSETETRWIYVEPVVSTHHTSLTFAARHSRKAANVDLLRYDAIERSRSFGPDRTEPQNAKDMDRIAGEATEDLKTALAWFDEKGD